MKILSMLLFCFSSFAADADSLSGKYLYNVRLHFEANDSGTQQPYTDPALVAKWVPEAVAFQKLVESMGVFADYQMTYDAIIGISKGPKVEGTNLNWIQWVASRKLSNGKPAAYLNPRAHGGQMTFNATDSYKALYDTLKEVGLETSKNFEPSALGSFEATDADLASGVVPVYNTALTGKIYKTTSYLWKVLQGPGTHVASAPRTGGMRKMANGQIVIHDGDGDLGTTLEGLTAIKNKQLPCVIAFLMVKPWYLKNSTNSFYTASGVTASEYLPPLITEIKTFKGSKNLSLSAMAGLYPGADYVYDAKTYLVK